MAPDTERLIATHSRFFALYDRVFSDAEKRVPAAPPSSPLPLIATTQPATDLSSDLDLDETLTAPRLETEQEYELVHEKFLDFFYHRIVLQEPSPPPSSGGTALESTSDDDIQVIEDPTQLQEQPQLQKQPQLQEQPQLQKQQQSTPEQPLTQDQQQHIQRPTEPLANEKPTQAAAPEPEIGVNNLVSSDKGPAATLPEKPLIPRKRSREPSIAASSAAKKTNDTEQAPPKRSVSELGDDEDEEGLVGARRHRRIVLHVKPPPQQQSSAAKEKQGSPAAIRVPPEDLSLPIKAIVQEDEKNGEKKNGEKDNEEKGDEIVEPRTQYIVVASKPIPYAHQPLKRDRMANGSSAQPLRISSAGTAPRKRKLDIVDQLWSIKFQRRRGGSSSRRGSVRPGVALPCLPKNLARPAARAQLLRDARAAAAIPLSTVYPQIAEKINELVATNRAEPPKPTKD